jgi:hypothetical protein
VEILTGAGGPPFQSISRRTAKTRTPQEVEFIVTRIAELTDRIMLPFFDDLRPCTAHNRATRELLEALNDASALAVPVQSKCRAVLFDGTGKRHVFEEHVDRLKERAQELRERGDNVPAYIATQLNYCDSVARALQDREDGVKLHRAYYLFNIDVQNFQNREKATVEHETRELRARGKAIFDALSTQAFQLGYLMAVLTHVEITLPSGATYEERLAATSFMSQLYLHGLNAFFAVGSTRHRTLAGYVAEPRARAFDANEQGFRGLIAAGNVRELNEKQWEILPLRGHGNHSFTIGIE